MNPVTVEYVLGSTQHANTVKDGVLMIKLVSAELFERWRQAINTGELNHVVLSGPGVCTGWRIQVARRVVFQERPPIHEQDAMCQRQAALRIVQEGTYHAEEVSPYNLIQEWVEKDKHYPWRVLVVCTLLNRTHGRGVRPIVDQLFEKCPNPIVMLDADLTDILQPLGLKNMRNKRLKHLTQDYLANVPYDKMAGVGKYGTDCLRIFCGGETNIDTDDKWLEPYLKWRRAGGHAVVWEWDAHYQWRDA